MWPSLIVLKITSADVVPTWSACAANPNDIMGSVHNMHAEVSWASLCTIDVTHYTYWPGMHACQLLT